MARTSGLSANLNAFLDTIAISELGREILAESDDGYDVLVGSVPGDVQVFHSYAVHPGVRVQVTPTLVSTAAGRYQVLQRYADVYMAKLGLPDFGPESQDAIAIEMIGECRALRMIEVGDIQTSLIACSSRWASLPAAKYGQHTNAMTTLLAAYNQAGGTGASA
ncbi:MAG: glycoside hydrolase family 104 protein [Proteobacteria bacterium]|nr:glycoside hydrolase family 104 protein [Pseudomonadota bacterium]